MTTGPWPRRVVAVCALVALVKLWLVSGEPLTVIWNSDERTFLLQAQGLLAGAWLGDYTVVSLVKEPFFAMFLAGVFILGLPFLFAQQLLYVLACGLFLVAARPAIASWKPYQLALLYALLVFNPMSFLGSPRMIRNHLYTSLTLLLLACAVALLLRADRGLKRALAWSGAFAVALTALWLTREESLWVLPFALVFTAMTGWRLWATPQRRWLGGLVVLAVPYVVLLASVLTVSALNQWAYGFFATSELKSRAFLDAFGAMYRVVPVKPRPAYVVVPMETRERLYAVSPAFAELRPSLEGDRAKPYTDLSCSMYQICVDRDVAWGWSMWQLREAVMNAGHHRTAADAVRFYGRLAAEINGACASGKLSCLAPRSSMLPPWDGGWLGAFPVAFVRVLEPLVTFRNFYRDRLLSVGPAAELAKFEDLTGEDVTSAPLERLSMTGWVVSTRGPVELSVRDASGVLIESSRRPMQRPDVRDYLVRFGVDRGQGLETGFVVSAACGAGCAVYARTGGGEWVRTLPFDGSVKRFQSTPAAEIARAQGKNHDLLAVERGDVLMYLDGVKPVEAVADRGLRDKRQAWKAAILRGLGSLYQTIVPALVAMSLLLFVAHMAAWSKAGAVPPLDLVVLLVLVLLGSRVAALAFTDVVAIKLSASPEYSNAGYPLVLLFVGLLLLKPEFWMARQPSALGARGR